MRVRNHQDLSWDCPASEAHGALPKLTNLHSTASNFYNGSELARVLHGMVHTGGCTGGSSGITNGNNLLCNDTPRRLACSSGKQWQGMLFLDRNAVQHDVPVTNTLTVP
jgi:hypothetical protein